MKTMMSYTIRIAALAGMLVALAPPASAQSYGYGTPAPAPPPPAAPGYAPPQPAAPGYPPPSYPPPGYPPPPGSRCEATYAGYRRRRFVCPMRVAKPIGAPCHCVPDAAPGYPPGPPIRGRVIP